MTAPWWIHEEALPEHVKAVMRDLLVVALREAATEEDPGDGYMHSLSSATDKSIDGGMWEPGGWKLQSSVMHDVRMHPKPYVVVHAYQGDQLAKGSVCAEIERTVAEQRALLERRLAIMVKRRDAMTADIERLRAKLEWEEKT